MSSHKHKSVDMNPELPDPTYEDRDINLKALGVFAILVVIVVATTFISMYWMFKALNGTNPTPVEIAENYDNTTGNRLQVWGPQEYDKYDETQDRHLKSYKWQNKEEGTVSIPIDDAIRLLTTPAKKPAAEAHHGKGEHGEKHGGEHHEEKTPDSGLQPSEPETSKTPEPAPAPKPTPTPEPKPTPKTEVAKPEPTPAPEPAPKPETAKPEPAPKPIPAKPEPKPEVAKPEPAPVKPVPAKPKADPAPAAVAGTIVDPHAGMKADLMKVGQANFAICASCHGPDGKGLQLGPAGLMAPTFVGSKHILGEPDQLTLIVLKGIKKEDNKYLGVMAPLGGGLDDKKMAGVLTYVRNSFGNEAPVITPAMVKEIRAKYKDRTDPVTRAELAKLLEAEVKPADASKPDPAPAKEDAAPKKVPPAAVPAPAPAEPKLKIEPGKVDVKPGKVDVKPSKVEVKPGKVEVKPAPAPAKPAPAKKPTLAELKADLSKSLEKGLPLGHPKVKVLQAKIDALEKAAKPGSDPAAEKAEDAEEVDARELLRRRILEAQKGSK